MRARLLTERFYLWEVRGRGWLCWDKPVELEPPFVPFVHRVPRSVEVHDDGRVPTLLSRLADGVGRLLSPARPEEPDDLLTFDPVTDDSQFERAHVSILLPGNVRVPPDLARQIILSFGTPRCPLCFELLATGGRISFQLSGEQSDVSHSAALIRAFLPEAAVTVVSDCLPECLTEPRPMVAVDFGLGEEFMRPLKVWQSHDTDPFVALVGAMAELPSGASALLQVLFSPVRHPWAASALAAVSDGSGGSFFSDDPSMLPLAREKFGLPLYTASVRIAASGDTERDAWNLARRVGGSLMMLNAPGGNCLIALDDANYSMDEHVEDVLARRTPRPGMILNLAELASLVHPPSAEVRTPELQRLRASTKAAPSECARGELRIGTNAHRGDTQGVWLTTQQRLRHCHLIGGSGTGKSTLLLQMMLQDAEAGRGFALLDPHGDLSDQLLDRLPGKRVSDVCLFDPADEEFPVGLNILQARSETEKTLLSSDLVAVMRRLSTSWGDQMSSVLGNAILAILEHKDGGTLLDLRRLLVEPSFRDQYLGGVQDPEVIYYWQREFPLLAGKPQASLLTRLDSFLRPRVIRHMVAQKDSRLDFRRILDHDGILIGKLPQGLIGEENAFLLGTLLVTKLHQAALGRQDARAEDRKPFYLYIDEFHNFVTPSMAPILSGVRKFGLGLVLAHQEMRQLGRDSEVANAVLSNAAVRVCFRLGDSDARTLASGFTAFDATQLQQLGVGEAVCRVQRSDWDFNLLTEKLPEVDDADAAARRLRSREHSRQAFARPVEEVRAVLEKARPTGPPPAPASRRREKQTTAADDSDQRRPVVPAATSPEPKAVVLPEPPSVPNPTQEVEQPKADVPPVSSPPEPVADPSPAIPVVPIPPQSAAPQVPAGSPPPTMEAPTDEQTVSPKREPAPQGKGGPEHQYLQQLIKQWGDGMGWKSTIECPLKDGASIDVELRKAKHRIGVEISVTTDAAQEMQNIRKCLAAGCTAVVAVGTKPRRLTKLRGMVDVDLPAKERDRVRCCSPEELFAWLTELDATITTKTTTSRGYRVNLSYQGLSETQKSARQQAISKVIIDSTRRMAQEE